MNDKIKACCENCANSDSYCNKRGFCNWYDGIGQTPEQRIAELEAENKELKDRISQAEKMVDVRKLVKPLQWVDTNNKTRSDCRLGNLWICVYAAQWTPDPNSDLWFIGHSASSEQCIDSLSHIDNDATNLEEAKRCAQDWLVSLVANACGLESEVQNDK